MGFLMDDDEILLFHLHKLEMLLRGVQRPDDVSEEMMRTAKWCWLFQSGAGYHLIGEQLMRHGHVGVAAHMFHLMCAGPDAASSGP